MSISPSLDRSATGAASRVFFICAISFICTYMHREAASVSIIAFVQTLEAAVIAEKAAREKRLAAVRKRDAERRREADRQKAAAECAETSVGGQK